MVMLAPVALLQVAQMLDLLLAAPCGKLRQISAAAKGLVTNHVLQVCTDPDFPGPDDKDRKEFVHWLVINIPDGAGLYQHKTPPATNPFAPHAPSTPASPAAAVVQLPA